MRVFAACVALIVAGPTLGEPAPVDQPAPFQAYCSIAAVRDAAGGQTGSVLPTPEQQRPQLLAFPVRDRDNVLADGNSADGRYYWYVRRGGEGRDAHMIHGVYDRDTHLFQTTRSGIVAPSEGSAMIALAASYGWSCTPVTD